MIRHLLTVAASLAMITVAPAAADNYPPRPVPGPTKPFKVAAAETYRLANGMQVTLIPYGQVPKAVINVRIYAGGLNAGSNEGLTSLNALMLREGAADRSSSQIAEASAAMGGSLLVNTGIHETVLGLGVLSDRAPEAVRLLGDIARHPSFPASEFDRVKTGLIRNILIGKSQPQVAAAAALAAAYYGADSPYGNVLPDENKVKGYTLDQVKQFYQKNFGAARARIYVAGQFDTAAVKAAIEQAFGSWAAGPERMRIPPNPRPGPKVILVDRPGAPQSTIRLAFPAPAHGTAEDIPFQVTDALLGGSFTSRITANIREQKGYTYSPFSTINYNPGEGQWEFDADVTSGVTGPALKEVFGEIRRLQTEPVPDQEAKGIRTWIAGTFVLRNASAAGLIGSLAERDQYGLPANWLDTYVPNVLAVPDAELNTLAREYLPLNRATLVVVGDLKTVEPQLKALPELQNVPFQVVKPF
jgi:zinc protease